MRKIGCKNVTVRCVKGEWIGGAASSDFTYSGHRKVGY